MNTKNGVSNYQTYCMGLLRERCGGCEDGRHVYESVNGPAEVPHMV